MAIINWFRNSGIPTISKSAQSVREYGRLSICLALQMEQYIQEVEAKVNSSVDFLTISTQKAELGRLESLGLGSSINARVLRDSIEAANKATDSTIKARQLITFVKALREHFGKNTLLVGTEQFEAVCKKYGLVAGVLSEYTGVVPESNIRDIASVTSKINSFPYRAWLNAINEGRLVHIEKVRNTGVADDTIAAGNALVYYIENINRILVSPSNRTTLTGLKELNKLPKACYGTNNPSLISIEGIDIEYDTLLIACPKEQLRTRNIVLESKPIDPIIFQRTDYGVIIYTMWGEEAEDTVFEEYKRINNLMGI